MTTRTDTVDYIGDMAEQLQDTVVESGEGIIGSLIAKEQIGPMQIFSLAMVLAGVLLTSIKKAPAL